MTDAITSTDWFEAARDLSTAEVSDALDSLRLPGSALGIQHIAGPARLFGRAYTMRFNPIDVDEPGTVGDYIDDIPPGTVLVLDNAGRMDGTVWGGILSQLAAAKKIAGTVVHGVCRDTAEAEAAGYPLYANGRYMRTGKDRVQVDAYQEPVSLGNVRVCPGDLVVGDQDGIVVVPQAHIEAVLRKALATRAVEEKILQAALAGMPLAQARREFGYHTLQRAPDSPLAS